MIHSSAHGLLTEASSLPREHLLLFTPDALSACQHMKKHTGGLADSLEVSKASSSAAL